MAQAFCRLGSKVTLVEEWEHILPHDDRDAARLVSEAFIGEGVEIHCKVRAEKVWQDTKDIHLSAGSKEIVGDTLLVAVGRRPELDGLDLSLAGV